MPRDCHLVMPRARSTATSTRRRRTAVASACPTAPSASSTRNTPSATGSTCTSRSCPITSGSLGGSNASPWAPAPFAASARRVATAPPGPPARGAGGQQADALGGPLAFSLGLGLRQGDPPPQEGGKARRQPANYTPYRGVLGNAGGVAAPRFVAPVSRRRHRNPGG